MTRYGDFIESNDTTNSGIRLWCNVLCEQEIATLQALNQEGKIPDNATLKISWQVEVVDL